MRVQVTLRGVLAGNGQPQHRQTVQLPWGSTVDYLIGHLAIPSGDVQMALVNGSPAIRSAALSDGDRVVLAGAN